MTDRAALHWLKAEDFPHHWDVQARFADLDPNNHVNNIALAEMFSEGRRAFVHNMHDQVARRPGFHFVVGQSAVHYIREAKWPNRFTVGTGVLEIGTKSVRLGQAFFISGICGAVAEAVLVARQDSETIALDEAMRTHMETQRLRSDLLPRQLR